jgi:cold shock protein
VVHISRRQRYDELDDEEKRSRRRPAEPRYRRPNDEAEALFNKAPEGRITPATTEEIPTRTGKVKWFNDRQGFGFVTLDDGNDAFLPARAVRGEDPPPGTTVTVRIVESPKGFEVLEIVDFDLSTAKAQLGAHRRRDLGEPERTAAGTIAAQDWRGTYGFVTIDDTGERVFVSGAVVGACGIPSDSVAGARVEIGITRTPRGPAVAKIKVLL